MKGTFAGSLLLLVDMITGGVSLLHSGGNDWMQFLLLIPGGIGAGLVLQQSVNQFFTGGGNHFDFAEWELQRRAPIGDPPSPA